MDWWPVLAGLIPSIGVGFLFWLAMRAVVRADRNERAALASAQDQQLERDDSAPDSALGDQKPGTREAPSA